MSDRVQGEIEAAVLRGGEQDKFQAENEVRLSKGQTPTIDSKVYEPKEVRDAGYPLSNPTIQPNNHTKEGTRFYANRDSHDGTPLKPVTKVQDPITRLPQTTTYMTRSDDIFAKLESARSDVDVEMGLTNIYKQYIDYTNSLVDEDPVMAHEQANRIRWNTIDRLESTGFDHLNRSEYTDEGIDDTGMNGLQMVFAAGIFQGKEYETILQDVGDVGANDAQLEEAYDRAVQGNERAQYNVVSGLPKTNEEAMADPRYAGAVRTLMEAGGTSAEELNNMSTEDILSKGKWMSDMLKSNLMALPAAAYDIKANPDSPIAEALTFLLQTDENLPFEAADVGRWTAGMLGDPTTYLGGYGIWSKFLSKKGSGAVLAKLGVGATFGAGMGAGYGSLYDIGMQNIDIAARNQKGFDPARLGQTAAIGATLGYLLGAGMAGLTVGAKAIIGRMRRTDLDGLYPDGAGGYTPLTPEEQVAERAFNIKMEKLNSLDVKERDKLLDTFDPDELTKVQDWLDHDRVLNPNPGESSGTMGYVSAADEFADAPLPGNVIPEAELRVRRELRTFMEEDKLRKMADDEELQKEFVDLANKAAELEEKRLKVIKGGKAADAPDDPTHMAPMELVRNEQLIADQADADVLLAKIEKHNLDTPEGLKEYRSEFYTKVQQRMLEANDIVQKHIDAGDFRFKIDDTVVSKHSGKEFKIHHLKWDTKGKKKGEPQYFVTGPDGEKHYMSEWGMVGGKPKLELVNGVPLEDFPE